MRWLILLLIGAPLAFGTTEPWSRFLAAVVAFAALQSILTESAKKNHPLYRVPGLSALFALAGFLILQVLPLPESVVSLVSPESARIIRENLLPLKPDAVFRISLAPGETLAQLAWLLVGIAVYWCGVQTLSAKENLKRFLLILVLFGGALSASSILQNGLTKDMALWFRHVPDNAYVFGPYVCHNHYAGLMEMLFPISLALFFAYRPTVLYGSFRERVVEAFSEKRIHTHILAGFSALLMAGSIFLSLSRGGIIGCSVSALVFLFWLRIQGQGNGKATISLAVVFGILIFVSWFGWDAIFQRFSDIRQADGTIHNSRLDYWSDATAAIRQFALTGTGFGSFKDVFPMFQTTFSGSRLVDHAHNDYVELAFEGGMIGIALFSWFFASLFIAGFQAFIARKERYAILTFMGAACGIFAIAVHSVTDFNMHVGANVLVFSLLCAILMATAHTRLRQGFSPTLLIPARIPKMPLFRHLVLLFLLPVLVFLGGRMAGAYYFSFMDTITISTKSSPAELSTIQAASRKASLADPFTPRYRMAMADTAFLLQDKETTKNAYATALTLAPTRSEFLSRAGLSISWLHHDHATADQLMRAAVKAFPTRSKPSETYAVWLHSQGKTDAASNAFRTAMATEPRKTKQILATMKRLGFGPVYQTMSLPPLAAPHLLLARQVRNTPHAYLEEGLLLQAVQIAESDPESKPAPWAALAGFYRRQKKSDQELDVLIAGTRQHPEDVKLRFRLAQLYEKNKIFYRALEEYRTILIVEPFHKTAGRKVRTLEEMGITG